MIVEPYGGISNRLKCIISSIAEYGDITLKWDIPNNGGGVRCDFNDLFTNNFNQSKSNKNIRDCKFIHVNMNTHDTNIPKENLNKELQKKYIDVISTLTPINYIQDKVNELYDNLPNGYNTVSVRTFKSFDKEYESWGRYFNIELLYKELDNINEPFLLTCDNDDTLIQIKNRYKDLVITTPKRTNFGDFKTVIGMQDILIDLILGGMGKKIYGTQLSSFSEMQWWLGGCKSEYKQMKLNNK
jgi:hypothetical protein